MNLGKMLIELGFKPKPRREGLAAPPVLFPRDTSGSSLGYSETREEVASAIDASKNPADRAFPSRKYGRPV
jgi:hypothetical protein